MVKIEYKIFKRINKISNHFLTLISRQSFLILESSNSISFYKLFNENVHKTIIKSFKQIFSVFLSFFSDNTTQEQNRHLFWELTRYSVDNNWKTMWTKITNQFHHNFHLDRHLCVINARFNPSYAINATNN